LSCTATHPLHTRFANIFDASVSEATMRPNPREAPRRRKRRPRRSRACSSTSATPFQPPASSANRRSCQLRSVGRGGDGQFYCMFQAQNFGRHRRVSTDFDSKFPQRRGGSLDSAHRTLASTLYGEPGWTHTITARAAASGGRPQAEQRPQRRRGGPARGRALEHGAVHVVPAPPPRPCPERSQ
jgi:hypothetical protein